MWVLDKSWWTNLSCMLISELHNCKSSEQSKWPDLTWNCLFNLYAQYIMWNARLDKAQTGIKVARRNINNLRCADDITLMAENEKELKNLLMKVKEESKIVGLKAQHSKNKDPGIQSHHFITNRWGKNGNSERLYFLGLQSHCRWWLQPQNEKMVVPWKKSYDKPRQHIKKQRHHFADKGLYS